MWMLRFSARRCYQPRRRAVPRKDAAKRRAAWLPLNSTKNAAPFNAVCRTVATNTGVPRSGLSSSTVEAARVDA